MEPPARSDADAVRDEKLKVLRALRPIDAAQTSLRKTVRGQYRAGAVGGQPVPGYLEETGVAGRQRAPKPSSRCKARDRQLALGRRAVLPAHRQAPAGRASRRSSSSSSTCRIRSSTARRAQPANRLVIRLQPDESITLTIMAKQPGEAHAPAARSISRSTSPRSFKARRLDAYERLLMDVVHGNPTLFMRRDEARRRLALDRSDPRRLGARRRPQAYTAGSWGPAAAPSLLGRDGFAWHEEA